MEDNYNKQIMESRIPSILFQCTLNSKYYFKTFRRTLINLSYKIIGRNETEPDEPTIFFIHGLLGSKYHWGSLGKTINNITKRTVVTVDLRNHGKSPHANSHKYEELAADVLNLFKKLKIGKASLVGHDMGGRAAMCVSLIAPEKVAGLVVIDISPVSTAKQFEHDYNKYLDAMKSVDFKNAKNVGNARNDIEKQLKDTITDDAIMSFVLTNVNVKPDGTIGWTCNLDTLIKHFKYIKSFPKVMKEKKYTGPTLFIGGQMSEFLPPDDLNNIREIFPRAVITYVPKAGHNVQVDDPKAFLELTISFLKTNK